MIDRTLRPSLISSFAFCCFLVTAAVLNSFPGPWIHVVAVSPAVDIPYWFSEQIVFLVPDALASFLRIPFPVSISLAGICE